MGEDSLCEGIHILPQNTVYNLVRYAQHFGYGAL